MPLLVIMIMMFKHLTQKVSYLKHMYFELIITILISHLLSNIIPSGAGVRQFALLSLWFKFRICSGNWRVGMPLVLYFMLISVWLAFAIRTGVYRPDIQTGSAPLLMIKILLTHPVHQWKHEDSDYELTLMDSKFLSFSWLRPVAFFAWAVASCSAARRSMSLASYSFKESRMLLTSPLFSTWWFSSQLLIRFSTVIHYFMFSTWEMNMLQLSYKDFRRRVGFLLISWFSSNLRGNGEKRN